jgi:hypothetical protein
MGLKNHARDTLAILRMVQLDDLRSQLAQPPFVLVIGPDARAAQQLAFALAGGDVPDEQTARATMTVTTSDMLDGLIVGPVPYDAMLLIDPTDEVRRHPAVRRLAGNWNETAVLSIRTDPDVPIDPGIPGLVVPDPTLPGALHTVRQRLIPLLNPNRRIAWGHTYEGFRQLITDHLIEQTARTNAQFAIVADIGAKIPYVGNWVAGGADFLVLTKNQLNLAYQLAAMHGKDLSSQWTVFTSAAPYILAGLGWRELARHAVEFVPGASFVPKAAVAYGGTVVSGLLARALADPDGVRAWLNGVQTGTKTSLGVTGVGLRKVMGRVKGQVGSIIGGIEDRFGTRTNLRPNWRRTRPGIDLERPVHVIPAAD